MTPSNKKVKYNHPSYPIPPGSVKLLIYDESILPVRYVFVTYWLIIDFMVVNGILWGIKQFSNFKLRKCIWNTFTTSSQEMENVDIFLLQACLKKYCPTSGIQHQLAIPCLSFFSCSAFTRNCRALCSAVRQRRSATPYIFRHHAIAYGWLSNSSVWDSNHRYLIRRTY